MITLRSILSFLILISPPPSLAFVLPRHSSSASQARAFVAAANPSRRLTSLKMSGEDSSRYSLADQPARFARAKKENNQRYLDITTVYDPSYLKGLRVAVTGANRGIGLALATELTEAGANVVAIVRSSSPELDALKPAEIITGIDVTNDEQCEGIKDQIKGGPIDIVSSQYDFELFLMNHLLLAHIWLCFAISFHMPLLTQNFHFCC